MLVFKKYTKTELRQWMVSKAKTASGLRRRLVTNTDRNRDKTVLGKLYFFWYDPKHKDTLPVYDRFPLVFPIEPYSDGFLGLNLHYLSIVERSALLNRLMVYTTSKTLNDQTRLKLTYDTLASTRALSSIARPCIKRYLYGHVRSMYVEVTADEWDKASQLPVELFVTNTR